MTGKKHGDIWRPSKLQVCGRKIDFDIGMVLIMEPNDPNSIT